MTKYKCYKTKQIQDRIPFINNYKHNKQNISHNKKINNKNSNKL